MDRLSSNPKDISTIFSYMVLLTYYFLSHERIFLLTYRRNNLCCCLFTICGFIEVDVIDSYIRFNCRVDYVCMFVTLSAIAQYISLTISYSSFTSSFVACPLTLHCHFPNTTFCVYTETQTYLCTSAYACLSVAFASGFGWLELILAICCISCIICEI